MKRRLPNLGVGLLEMLVALSIMALAITAIYRAVGGSLRGIAQIENVQAASQLGHSLLDEYAVVDPQGMLQHGKYGDFSWSISSTPVGASSPDTVALQDVYVTISWGVQQWGLHTKRPQRLGEAP